MFTALTLSLALGAPVPNAPEAPPAGTAPRLMELKPDANGKLTVTVIRTEMQKVPVAVGNAVNPGGGAPPAVLEREVPVTKHLVVELGEVKDLTVTTADGKKLENAEALKKLEKGGIVVVSGDGKPVSPTFLKVFKDDTLVLASPELTAPQFNTMPGGRPGIRPLPAVIPPGGGVQILPAVVPPGGAIQVQVQGGVVQVAPALPAVPPPQVEKPAKPPEK